MEWNRALLTMTLISGADISIACIRATGGQFEYQPWHKLAKTLLSVRNNGWNF